MSSERERSSENKCNRYHENAVDYRIKYPYSPELPTPINTVTNMENLLAASTVSAMAINSCGLLDTK